MTRIFIICILAKYYSCDQIENYEIGGTFGRYGGKRGVYRVLVGRPDGQRPLGRPMLDGG
jgi:hypothetical protein